MLLTPTQIKYLVAINRLGCETSVRSADIAEALEVTKPTVHSMLVSLARLELIKKEKYSCIELTGRGRWFAELYANGFSAISLLLNSRLRIPVSTAGEGALAILSCLGPEELSLRFSRGAAEPVNDEAFPPQRLP
ncbi:MAG: helix-turn-helix domain-containing protein [Oscillospiraceae bacterium]|jgi:Mn-dependent DtxR family transcriptional regulator|nr:helix-turn-helix domain-containing protein [Oscillospiraceae bacterium]